MEIRCPNAQRNGAGVDFFPVAVADPVMQRQVSSPPAMTTRQVSWSAPLSRVPADSSQVATLPRRVMQTLSCSGRDIPQAVYFDRSCARVETPPEYDTSIGSPGVTLEGVSIEGTMASSIADNVIDHLKKQLDRMTIDLARQTGKLLKSVSAQLLERARMPDPSTLSAAPDCSEGGFPGSSEPVLGPDGSLVPIPVWAQGLVHSSQDAKPGTGQKFSPDQPLPSVVEDDWFDPFRLKRQVSPLSDAPSKSGKRVHFVFSDLQHEMQRAAVIMKERAEGTGDVTPSSSVQQGRLPRSVTGAWRRQAAILGRRFREEMEEEVHWQVTKNNMSFHGGLWWLRHITGVRSLTEPWKAACISACNIFLMIALFLWHLQITSAVPGHMLLSVLDVAMICSGALALTIHHACCKLSENCSTTGEQDAMLQSHSLAFGYSDDWLKLSRKQGWRLLCIWLASNAAACASYIHKAQALPEDGQSYFIVTGSLHFMIASTILCSLCMRVAHICAAMKIALISYMQQFAEPLVDFNDMVQEWNAVQIFIRTLSDGCAPSLACQVAMIPVMVISALLQMLLTHMSFLQLTVTITPFFVASGMPYFALVCAADTSMQCEQAAQVANSLLVGQLGNPDAQKFLDFMSRCRLGFFINDLRISAGGVMKYTYVLVGVFVTVASSVVESRT